MPVQPTPYAYAVAPGDAAVNTKKDKMARVLLLGALPEDVLL